MKQYRLKRVVALISVVEGQFATFELPRGLDYESLTLRLSGTVTVTTGGTLVRAEAPCQLVPRVEISSNGQLTHYSAPLWHSVFTGHENAPNANRAKSPAVPPTAASAAAYAVEATGVINFNTPDGERPKDSNLATVGFTLFTLRLTFGQSASMFTGSAVSTFTGTVEVSTSELVEEVAADGSRTMPLLLKKVTTQEVAAASDTDSHEILLPSGNLFRSVLLRAEASTGEPTLTLLNKMRLESNNDVRVNLSAKALRYENAKTHGWLTDGYYLLDVARSGNFARLSELWDLSNQAQPKVISDLDGSSGQKVQAVVTEYIKLGK